MEQKVLFISRDMTLIRTKSGKISPQDTDDWELKNDVAEKLEEMLQQDFVIIITCNCPGISKGYATKELQEKVCQGIIERFPEDCHSRFHYYISESADSLWYKPDPEAVEELRKKYSVDIFNSIVVGNSKWDQQFARNINLSFIPDFKFFKCQQTVTVLVGFPNSGKSSHCSVFHHWDARVSIEDIIKSMNEEYRIEWKRIYYEIEEKMIQSTLLNGYNVVIDRVDLSREKRVRFFRIIDKTEKILSAHNPDSSKIKVQAKYFNIPLSVCKERWINSPERTESEKWEADDIFDRLESEFEMPTIEEGFDEIITLDQEDFHLT